MDQPHVTSIFLLWIVAGLGGCVSGEAEICYECLEGEIASFCTSQESFSRCYNSQGTCFSQFKRQPGSSTLTASKGCMERWVCLELQRRNPVECSTGEVTDKCTFCCHEDYCNTHTVGVSTTTTTTTTPQPPPTTTTAALSTTPPRNILAEVERCMATYRENVVTVLVDPMQRFGAFCSNVSHVFGCVSSAMPKCDDDAKAATRELLVQYVSDALRGACPVRCHAKDGLECIRRTHTATLTAFMTTPTLSCTTLYSEVEMTKRCVAFSTYTCSNAIYKRYEYTLQSIHVAIQITCATIETASTTVPMPAATTTTTTTTAAPGPCAVSTALACLADVGEAITTARTQGLDFEDICGIAIPYAINCAHSNTRWCPDDTYARVRLAVTYIESLVLNECSGNATTTSTAVPWPASSTGPATSSTPAPPTPPPCATAAARLCIVTLWSLIEQQQNFEKACSTIESTTQCVVDNTIGCTDVEKTSLNKTLANVLELIGNRCEDIVECPADVEVRVKEGGEAAWIEYSFRRNPASLCPQKDCRVYMDIVPDQSGPTCRNKYSITQLAIGGEGTTNFCSKEITNDNWASKHRFSVAAREDYAMDGEQRRNVTIAIRKVVNGRSIEIRVVCEVTVVVIDGDFRNHTCRSYNDPHMVTFDGFKYNNFQTGFHTLYRHTTLPYQVQVAFYSCSGTASCLCAVAVQSGDSVFVVDQCDRRSRKDLCRRQRDHYFCSSGGPQQRVRMYFHDQVTPGTRVFRGHAGKLYEVLLPTGTVVAINLYTHQINVAVTSSGADVGATEGMCGWYDGDKYNDLRMPSGRFASTSLSKRREPSDTYMNAWKVPASDRIFYAVPRDPYFPSSYCECRPSIDSPDAAPYSHCSASALFDTCRFTNSKEVTFSIPREPQFKQRTKREAEDPYTDWEVEPKLEVPVDHGWTESSALVFCQEYLVANSSFVRQCMRELDLRVGWEVESCAEDIMAVGDTSFASVTLTVLKSICLDLLTYDTELTGSEAGQRLLQELQAQDCPGDCSRKGQCVDGMCVCDIGSRGVDCSVDGPLGAPTGLFIEQLGLCPRPQNTSDCASAMVFGAGFEASDNLTCHFKPVEISGLPSSAAAETDAPGLLLTDTQLLCPMPAAAPYMLTVSNDGVTYSSQESAVQFVPYADACFDCVVVGLSGKTQCSRKLTACYIGDVCYGPGEQQPDDPCQACDPSISTDDWTRSSRSGCDSSNVLVIVLVCLAVLTILIIVGVCICYCRRHRSSKRSHGAIASNGSSGEGDRQVTYTASKPTVQYVGTSQPMTKEPETSSKV